MKKTSSANHLASLTERLSQASTLLPAHLSSEFIRHQNTTEQFKICMEGALPDAILQNCWVIKQTKSELTITLNSVTALNHMRFQQDLVLHYLQQNPYFVDVVALKFFLMNTKSSTDATVHTQNINPQTKRLSQETRDTITQTTELCITDKNLSDALLRLAKDE